jgi:hypothetical protein
VNLSAAKVGDRPPGVATVTSTLPAFPGGDKALHEVVEVHDRELGPARPKLADVEPTTNPEPVMAT